jgi:hypothetical protein
MRQRHLGDLGGDAWALGAPVAKSAAEAMSGRVGLIHAPSLLRPRPAPGPIARSEEPSPLHEFDRRSIGWSESLYLARQRGSPSARHAQVRADREDIISKIERFGGTFANEFTWSA